MRSILAGEFSKQGVSSVDGEGVAANRCNTELFAFSVGVCRVSNQIKPDVIANA